MKRTPQQLKALAKSQEEQVSQTRTNIESALERLQKAEPKYCDGKLTILNLSKESKVSKQTLYRYPEYIEKLEEIKKLTLSNTDLNDVIINEKDSKRLIRELKKEKAELQKKYNELEKIAKQEIMILNTHIQSLQKQLSRVESNVISLKK